MDEETRKLAIEILERGEELPVEMLEQMLPATNYSDKTKGELLLEIERLKNKYGLNWKNHPEDVALLLEENYPVLQEISEKQVIDAQNANAQNHLLIEGDNYHALAIMQYTHWAAVDVIYIDPPYNTGAKDWKYNNDFVDKNDSFRHSKWLSMMSHRLKLAKNLLKPQGVLICAIDENEVAPLGLLLEQLFPSHEVHCVTIVHNPRGVQGKNFSYVHEYAYFVVPSGIKSIGNRKIDDEDVDWRTLRDSGKESLRTDAKNCFYPIIVRGDDIVGFGDVCDDSIHPKDNEPQSDGTIYVYPVDTKGIERKWRYARQSVESIKNLLQVKKSKKQKRLEIEIGKDFGTVRTVWQSSKYDASEYGTKMIQDIVPEANFDYPKSLYITYDCIAPVVNENKEAVILDFFAGSGTTGHAVMELNKDGGNRQFILCTNNENNICEEVTHVRLQRVMQGYKNSKGVQVDGLGGGLRYFRCSLLPKTGDSTTDKYAIRDYCTDLLCLKENAFTLLCQHNSFRIYQGQNKVVGIFYDFKYQHLDEFKNFLATVNAENKIVYCFSTSGYVDNSLFKELDKNAKIKEIPQSILDIYNNIGRA